MTRHLWLTDLASDELKADNRDPAASYMHFSGLKQSMV
jgi:hypothetical protein